MWDHIIYVKVGVTESKMVMPTLKVIQFSFSIVKYGRNFYLFLGDMEKEVLACL